MLTNLVDLKLTCSVQVQPENMYNKMQFLLTSILGRLSNLKSLTLVPRASTDNAKSTDEAGATGMAISGGFSSKFKCCDPLLKFEEGAMRNLCKLKLVFNADNADKHITIPVGVSYLSNLKELSAKIGGAGSDESHRRAIELTFRDAVRVHARCERVSQNQVPRSEMSLCQLYTELAANPDCSPAGVLHDKKLSVKQNKIPAEEPSVKSDIVQSRKQADKRKRRGDRTTKTVVTIASPDADDGYTWRKYGLKPILGSNYPRGYYRCTQGRGCRARKDVQLRDGDPILYDVCYSGEHSCGLEPQPGHSNEQGSETNAIAGGWEAAGLPLSLPHAHGVEAVISSGSLTGHPNPGIHGHETCSDEQP